MKLLVYRDLSLGLPLVGKPKTIIVQQMKKDRLCAIRGTYHGLDRTREDCLRDQRAGLRTILTGFP